MTDLFDKTVVTDPNPDTVVTPQTETPNYNDLLASIKNENGEQKFKSIEDLASGYSASQSFISTLKTEKDAEVAKAQDLASKVLSQEQLQELLVTKPAAPEVVAPVAAADSLKAEDVLTILEQREAQKVVDANVVAVKEAMSKAFGAEASTKLKDLTSAVGLTQEAAQTLAQSSPQALLKLIGLEGKVEAPSVNASVNTSTFNNQSPSQATRVMGAGNSKDFMSEWSASIKRTNERLAK